MESGGRRGGGGCRCWEAPFCRRVRGLRWGLHFRPASGLPATRRKVWMRTWGLPPPGVREQCSFRLLPDVSADCVSWGTSLFRGPVLRHPALDNDTRIWQIHSQPLELRLVMSNRLIKHFAGVQAVGCGSEIVSLFQVGPQAPEPPDHQFQVVLYEHWLAGHIYVHRRGIGP